MAQASSCPAAWPGWVLGQPGCCGSSTLATPPGHKLVYASFPLAYALGASISTNPNRQTRLMRAWGMQSGNPGRTKRGPCNPPNIAPNIHTLFPRSRRPFPMGQYLLCSVGSPGPPPVSVGTPWRVSPLPFSSISFQEHPSFLSSHLNPRSTVSSSLQTKSGLEAGGKAPESSILGCKLLA